MFGIDCNRKVSPEKGQWFQLRLLPDFHQGQVVDFRWLKETHLKLRLALENSQVLDAIAFGAKDKLEFNPMRDDVRLVYELERNVFNGNVSLQLKPLSFFWGNLTVTVDTKHKSNTIFSYGF